MMVTVSLVSWEILRNDHTKPNTAKLLVVEVYIASCDTARWSNFLATLEISSCPLPSTPVNCRLLLRTSCTQPDSLIHGKLDTTKVPSGHIR